MTAPIVLDESPYGFCPRCGCKGKTRERRPHGNDSCFSGHVYRSTEAMIAALRGGHLRHAGLDVFDIEPLPAGHVLSTLPNVTLTAHSAFRTPEASNNLIRRALDIACGLGG